MSGIAGATAGALGGGTASAGGGFMGMLAPAIGSAGGGILGALGIGEKRRMKRELRYNKRLADYNKNIAKELGQFNHDLAMQMWNDTNYGAQVQHMKDAGLNIGLMYGSPGQGGTTQSSTPSANPGQNPNQPHIQGIGMQTAVAGMKALAEIELAKSQAKKNEAEAEKIKGVDTEESKQRIQESAQRIENLIQNAKTDREKELLQRSQRYVADREYDKLVEEINILADDRFISNNTRQERINIITNEAIQSELNHALTEAQTDLTKEQEKKAWHEIRQKWVANGLQGLDIIVKAVLGRMGIKKLGGGIKKSDLSDDARGFLLKDN